MSVKLIENLSDLNENGPVRSASIKVAAPTTDRLVIVQAIFEGRVYTIGARYRDGRWYGVSEHEDLTEQLMDCSDAVWSESFLFNNAAAHDHVNTQ